MLLVLAGTGIGADHKHVPDRVAEPRIDVVLGEPSADDSPTVAVIHQQHDVLVIDDDDTGHSHVFYLLEKQLT